MEKDKIYSLVEKELKQYLEKKESSTIVKRGDYTDIDLELAEKFVKEACSRAKEKSLNATFAVVDKGGNLVLLKRMDGAIIASIDVSVKKAFSAVLLNSPTSKVDLKQFPGLDRLYSDKLVVFGGGYPIVYKGNLIGAIGVSGGTSEDDENIAMTSVKCVIESLD